MQQYKPTVLELAAGKSSLQSIVSSLDDDFDEGNTEIFAVTLV